MTHDSDSGNKRSTDSEGGTAPDPLPTAAAGVYLIGTPIGNMEDITLRALRILAQADVLACEDTRVTRKLFARHGIPAPKTLVACNDHNEKQAAKYLAKMAADGKVVVYCSDAGMPGISDPGFTLLREAEERGVRVDVIPGPSAVTTAVALSGIGASMFTFFGFPPRRDGRLTRLLSAHGGARPALVFYESPRRLARLLALAAEAVDAARMAAVCLELTKKFQRVERGRLDFLAGVFAARETRGEAVVVIAGAEKKAAVDERELLSGVDADDDDEK